MQNSWICSIATAAAIIELLQRSSTAKQIVAMAVDPLHFEIPCLFVLFFTVTSLVNQWEWWELLLAVGICWLASKLDSWLGARAGRNRGQR